MPRWLDWLLGSDEKPAPSAPQPAKWLPPGDPGNPFGVPLLDLMQLQGVTATTANPLWAQRSVSWVRSTGAELSPDALLALPPVECSLRYPAAPSLPDGILYAPPSMDFKWVLALREGRVLAARSWTGEVEAIADARRDGEEIVLTELRVAQQSSLRISDQLVDVFDWLIRVHALDQRLPLPLDDVAADQLQAVPLSGFSPFGKALFCAAKSWSPPSPKTPLRSDGEVIVAARTGDAAALKRAVDHGADVDAPGTFRGFTALHIAVVRGDVALFGELVKLGANASTLADRATHALGIAVVHKAPIELLDAIAATPLDLTMPNADGFTALHAAAEADHGTVVPWLTAHGLPLEATTKHGHTALHIASALGHAQAAKALLAAGADIAATSPNGTPLEVARARNKPELVKLLSAKR